MIMVILTIRRSKSANTVPMANIMIKQGKVPAKYVYLVITRNGIHRTQNARNALATSTRTKTAVETARNVHMASIKTKPPKFCA